MSLTAKQQLSRNPSNAGYATPLKTYSVPATENPDKTINVPAQPVYGIDPNVEPIALFMATRAYPSGVYTTANVAVGIGATGQSFTVPADKVWLLHATIVDVVTTATVGNRIIQYRVFSPTGQNMWIGSASAAVAASQTGGYDVAFNANNQTPSTTVRRNIADSGNTNVQVRENCPIGRLRAGSILTVDDSANIDNADSVFAIITYTEYDA